MNWDYRDQQSSRIDLSGSGRIQTMRSLLFQVFLCTVYGWAAVDVPIGDELGVSYLTQSIIA